MFTSESVLNFSTLVLLLGVFSVALGYLSMRRASPVTAIFSRWMRWAFIAFSMAMLADAMGANRPLGVLVILGFLIWGLMETAYNWFAVNAISRSTIPLFPRFHRNESGDEWPNQPRFIALRDWLRKEGFKRTDALKSEIADVVVLRSSIYENEDETIRLQVMFLPQRSGNITFAFSLASQNEDGRRLITDNFFLPYGGYYPENWVMERRPLTRSVEKLLQRHKDRMQTMNGSAFLPWKSDSLNEINKQQHLLEALNTEAGFLNTQENQEVDGRLSAEGRYRVWKEIWLLSYFGRASTSQPGC